MKKQQVDRKKDYVKPELVIHGSVEKITENSGINGGDGIRGSEPL